MTEADFWVALEFRICREFTAMARSDLRFRWRDGLVPDAYELARPKSRVTGRAWICDGPKQEEWAFTLLLSKPVASREEIDWASLIPPPNVTKWMAVDIVGKRIEIEPSAAVPDLE